MRSKILLPALIVIFLAGTFASCTKNKVSPAKYTSNSSSKTSTSSTSSEDPEGSAHDDGGCGH